MTQAHVAEAVGVSVQAVSQWENGKNQPSLLNLISLAELFSVSLQWLSNGRDALEAPPYNTSGLDTGTKASLIDWNQYYEAMLTLSPWDFDSTIMLYPTNPTTNKIIALEIEDDSMLPLFNIQDIIFLDIWLLPEPGDFVAYRDPLYERVFFREYALKSASNRKGHVIELKPLNTNYPTRYVDPTNEEDNSTIYLAGTMIEHRKLRPSFKRSLMSHKA